MPKVLIAVRVDRKILEFLKEIASAKGEKCLSNIIREAIQEYVSSYIGEPTVKNLQKRIDEIEMRVRKLENSVLT